MMDVIGAIEFRLLSPEVIKKISVVEITKPELYDNDGFPVEGGVMDPRLGVIDPGLRCRTCGGRIGECQGHFGYIELVRPVIHVLYAKLIHTLLRLCCHNCGNYAGESQECGHCGAERKKIKLEKPHTFFEDGEELTPLQIRERLEKITDEALEKIGFRGGRPEWLVLTVLPVPPVTVRPSITLETGERSEDDLTHKLAEIIRINQHLKDNIIIGAPDFIIKDLWELLQYHVSTYFDNELPGIPQARHRSGRPLKTLSQRLKTKEGRFRHNLTGKRVNYSARTVISPDPCISINEVGVPVFVAKELTIPEPVRKDNLEELRNLVRNADEWPGVNYVIRPDGRRKKVTKENAEEIAQELAEGYIVERHLRDGDPVLFNRQPSLHRMSMMCHKVRVTPWRTFTLNLCVTPPYNADFDGDEMNLHAPQTVEARAEAELLMSVQRHIRSPRFGGPIIGCKQDHISGTYLLTRKGTRLRRSQAFQLLSECGVVPDLPKKEWFTGKEVFSFLLPQKLNLEFRAKACRGCKRCKKENCEYDCFVSIKGGKLKTGVIDGKAIGSESGKLIDVIEKNFGTEEAHKFIDRVSLLGIKYLQIHGFTIGLDNFDIPDSARKKIREYIESVKGKVVELVKKYEKGEIEVLPGLTERESLEMQILNVLKGVLDVSEEVVSRVLPENEAVVMSRSGARGGMVQLVQITGCVGQMTVLGERVHRGYYGRTLSHFKPGELSAEAHGFVTNSYKTGENILEFFFDLMSGREGLMDKSLRTKHSGYMERRLMNALQDMKVEYDFTVRDNRGVIIQFVPGEDGIDPAKSDWGELDVESVARSVIG